VLPFHNMAHTSPYTLSKKPLSSVCKHFIHANNVPHEWCIRCCVLGKPIKIRGELLQPPPVCSLERRCADCLTWTDDAFQAYISRVQLKQQQLAEAIGLSQDLPLTPSPTKSNKPVTGESPVAGPSGLSVSVPASHSAHSAPTSQPALLSKDNLQTQAAGASMMSMFPPAAFNFFASMASILAGAQQFGAQSSTGGLEPNRSREDGPPCRTGLPAAYGVSGQDSASTASQPQATRTRVDPKCCPFTTWLTHRHTP